MYGAPFGEDFYPTSQKTAGLAVDSGSTHRGAGLRCLQEGRADPCVLHEGGQRRSGESADDTGYPRGPIVVRAASVRPGTGPHALPRIDALQVRMVRSVWSHRGGPCYD